MVSLFIYDELMVVLDPRSLFELMAAVEPTRKDFEW